MNTLAALQEWYQRHCNGEWEHHYGIEIGTLDNPGWQVKVDLTGTPFELNGFEPIEENVDSEGWQQSHRWMHCHARDAVWHGAGDETSLERILSTFLRWAGETAQS
jgi:hypothetical protein